MPGKGASHIGSTLGLKQHLQTRQSPIVPPHAVSTCQRCSFLSLAMSALASTPCAGEVKGQL